MKVYGHRCPNDGTQYISVHESVTCDCGSVCECLDSGNSDILVEEVVQAILEADDKVVKVVYRHGKKFVVRKRKRHLTSTPAQRAAAANARKYNHTSDAVKNFRKSISARKENNLIGEK